MTGARDGRIVTFYSLKGGTGRTMALANVAWILASNGYRVLAADWDLEAPGLHRFFHPFLPPATVTSTTGVLNIFADFVEESRDSAPQSEPDRRRRHARVLPHAVSLEWTFPSNGTLDFLSAGRQDGEYLPNLLYFNWQQFDTFGGKWFVDALREDMRGQYDYVLIDSRNGVSEWGALCTTDLPDVLVNCFTLSSQSIEGAARVARSIVNDSIRGIRILPVPMRVGTGTAVADTRLTAGRELIRASFPDVPQNYWADVEIPHRPDYTYEETLATFGDRPGSPGSLLSALERLTAAITDGRVTQFPPLDDELRRRHLASFVRPVSPVATPLALNYVPQDRMWADWIRWVLTRSGFQVLTPAGADAAARPGVSPRTVALLSSSFLRSPQARTLWETHSTTHPGSPPKLVPVRIEPVTLTPPFTRYPLVDLSSLDEAQADAALLHGLDHHPEPTRQPPGAARPRFPKNVPAVMDAPPRNPLFVGRNRLLDELHATLDVSRRAVVLPRGRLGGAGRTQLAVEYAHRFQADYDLVRWIRAETRDSVLSALAQLAGQLGLPDLPAAGCDVPEAARRALEALDRGVPHGRWLLVYDNAGSPAELADFLPSGGPGQILVTSRDPAWAEQMDTVEVAAFGREQSVELLRRRAPALSLEDADRVAETLQDLPLAVDQAGIRLAQAGPADRYLRELAAQGEPPAAGDPAAWPLALTTRTALARLAERSPAAVRLLVLCSHLAPLPIPLGLVYNDTTLRILQAHDDTLREPLLLGGIVRQLSRLGLADVDQAGHTLRVHRVVQSLVRDALSPDERRETRHEAHRVLTAASPRREDGEDSHDDACEWLWPHLDHTGAQSCRDDGTRAVLIERLRRTARQGMPQRALDLGDRLEQAWARSGETGPDRQILLLRFRVAAVLRDLGRCREARELDADTLARQRELLPAGHPHILMTAEGLAADLRALGLFTQALELDQEASAGFRESFGDEHPRALSAAGALATSLRLTGDYEAARELDRTTLDMRREVLGPGHRSCVDSALGLARDLREAGEYAGSIGVLREVLETPHGLGAGSADELRVQVSLSVSLRRIGQRAEATGLASAAHERFRARRREDSAESLACASGLAALLADGEDPAAAVEGIRQLRRRFVRIRGAQHPDAVGCGHNLAVRLRAAGEFDEALETATRTVHAFTESLGNDHPYTLCGKVTLANTLGDLRQLDRAEELARACARTLRKVLGPGHPDTVICESNLAVTLRALDRGPEAARLRERALAEFRRKLGRAHVWTLAVQDWRRVDRDLEPLLPS